jgi:hypothetical protein
MLNIEYSPELEIERVSQTLKRAAWYREHGYASKLALPSGIDLDHDYTPEQIGQAIQAEYEESFYIDFKKQIENGFASMADSSVFAGSPLKFESSYRIKLTKYGTGGSYHLPKTIVINIVKMKASIAAILHEMIHLAIEPLIQQHAVSQHSKERLVDLLLKELFPGYAYEQSRFADNPQVDEAFETFYPDIAKLISHIK